MSGAVLEQSVQDFRYAARALARHPGFASVVVLTLALGIGMNTAVFSVIRAVLLRPLPYPDAQRLVWLSDYNFVHEQHDNYVGRSTYLQWREQVRSFESMTAYGNQDLALASGGESSQERIASIAGDFWSIVGARAQLGHLFGGAETHTIVLTDALYERRFARDPQILGKTISLNGYPFTITGVLPPGFRFEFPPQYATGDEVRAIDAYIPFPDAAMRFGEANFRRWEEATTTFGPAPYNLRVVAKLRPEVSLAQARAEMETVYARVARTYPAFLRGQVRLHFASLEEKLTGESRRALVVLLVAVGFVLLIACANVANLLLARASTRHREIAIRAALGAGRFRVMRQFLTESIVLALAGGAAGLLLAHWLLPAILRIAPDAVPRLGEARMDASVLAFTAAVSLATGLLFGLGPALSIGRGPLAETLKSDSGTISGSAARLRARALLVVAQLALAIVLLAGAGLLLKSFWRMEANAQAFRPEDTLVMRVSLSGSRYATSLQKSAYVQQVLERVEGLPGVLAAGVDCGNLITSVKVEGDGTADPSQPAVIRAVSADYLRAMGVPLVEGRWNARSELSGVLVNETFARRLKSNGALTGRHVSGAILNDTILGVVADFQYRQLDSEPAPEIYIPYERFLLIRSIKVVVRAAADPRSAASAIRNRVAEVDRSQPVYELQTLEQALAASIAPRRFNLFLLAAFAATALLMALLGIYGVIAWSVAQRTREIGIRMALGAGRFEIVGMVVRQGMTIALAGIAIGLAVAAGLTRLISSLLYGVKPGDPLTFAAVASLLAATALAACLAPALKAALVDPMVALHYE